MGVFRKIVVFALCITPLMAEESSEDRIAKLEEMLKSLSKEVTLLRSELAEKAGVKQKASVAVTDTKIEEPLTQEEIYTLKSLASTSDSGGFDKVLDPSDWVNRLSFGGYGEIHGNFSDGSGADRSDVHRLVMFAGYEFNSWAKFNTEIEIEHGFVDGDSGELEVEQAYVDFTLSDTYNIRVGRFLAPLGITNQTHEPTTFNGVERSLFDKYIIPTTWWLDGIGLFGSITPRLDYQAYVSSSLDGSKLDAKNGIRKGRMKGRQGLDQPAVSGRLDYQVLQPGDRGDQTLRLGLSGFYGGLDNNENGTASGASGTASIFAADYEYTIGDFDFKGNIAYIHISDAEEINNTFNNGVAEGIFGWNQEIAYHIMPQKWKVGKLVESDLIVFARYDFADTQYKMAGNATANGNYTRQETTVGVNFLVTPQLVLKADYQFRKTDDESDIGDLFNVGLGFNF